MPSALQPPADPALGRAEAIAAALKRRLPRDSAYTFVFNGVVAALLTLGGGGSFWTNFVYSQAIGLALLVLIDGGRLAFWPGREPPVVPMIGLVAVSIPVAVIGGGLLAAALVGAPRTGLGSGALWATLAITVAAAGFATYFFWTRERNAHFAAETAAERLRGTELARQAAEARFRQLAAQIEPHFLFNTLANLRALIETDPPRAVAMLDHLDGYLRASLAASRAGRVPLADECALIASFLEILAIRMGPRLAWRIDVPAALGEIAVPPMLLQPLVENAVKHGVEPKVGPAHIEVSAERTADGRLAITVADDGVGFGGASAGSGLGLANLRERLAQLYGDRAELTLRARPAGGVAATLTLPLDGA